MLHAFLPRASRRTVATSRLLALCLGASGLLAPVQEGITAHRGDEQAAGPRLELRQHPVPLALPVRGVLEKQ